jgi:signal transduction histidine kinase
MNNPIGVIHSAADTANRGIHKIKNLLRNDQNLDKSSHDKEQLQQFFKLLETNHKIITTASDRTAKIVQSLRTFARLDEALFQKVDIHANIDTTLTLVYHELRDKATVIKEYGDIPRIQGYPGELNQVFMNLLRNAAQSIEQQGTITIATYADRTQVYVRISDTGRGIPPGDLPRIYDPGFTTQDVGVGKGLGLSIVYSIVQKHQGYINVDSEVGKGTEVTIALTIEQTMLDA